MTICDEHCVLVHRLPAEAHYYFERGSSSGERASSCWSLVWTLKTNKEVAVAVGVSFLGYIARSR